MYGKGVTCRDKARINAIGPSSSKKVREYRNCLKHKSSRTELVSFNELPLLLKDVFAIT